MRFFKLCAAAGGLAIAVTSTAAAGTAPKASRQPGVQAGTAKVKAISPPDFKAIFAIFDKLFPPQPDPEPERLALARTSVAAMWPDGAYGRMMTGFMDGMVDRVMQMKPSDLAMIADKKKTNASAPAGKDLSLHDRAAAKDPYFDQRMAAMRDAMTEEVGKLSTIIDPRMREGLARSMARHFDAKQLGDINTFFATPTGRTFASQQFQLWLDPDTMRSIMGSVPEMMQLMPEMMQKIEAADRKFPKPPKTPANADKK